MFVLRWGWLGVAWISVFGAGCSSTASVDSFEALQAPPAGTARRDEHLTSGSGDRPRVRVNVGPLAVDVASGDSLRSFQVPVPTVEVFSAEAEPANAARRIRTPVVDVEIPELPARHVRTPVMDLDLDGDCEPGVPRRVRTPIATVEMPVEGIAVPRRVTVPIIEVVVPEGSTAIPMRVRIPSIEQNLERRAERPRLIHTPSIEIGLAAEGDLERPTRILVSVPGESADDAGRSVVPVERAKPRTAP